METVFEIEQERTELLLKQKELQQEVDELRIESVDVQNYLRKTAQLILIFDDLESNDRKLLNSD